MLALFAQQKGAANADAAAAAGGIMACFGTFFLIYMIFVAIIVVGMWKVYTKAGQPGWAVLVPFYNVYILVVEIAKRDMTWFLLSLFVPFAIIVPLMDVAEKFGKERIYGLGLAFLGFIFWPMLGFGDARYQGRRSSRDDDDDDDRPRRRRRDEDDEDEDDRPRRRRSRDDDDDDE